MYLNPVKSPGVLMHANTILMTTKHKKLNQYGGSMVIMTHGMYKTEMDHNKYNRATLTTAWNEANLAQ